ncbi:hypothetical protein Fmac_023154 [Flemingia macrophylla]|uniref:Adenylate isopentenyltransferase n=1 Tax=Flemingia macrophylla TaxID=520843 RepID=A0ABD1LKV0_9FABA
MRLSIVQPQYPQQYPIKRWARMEGAFQRRKEKVVVIMGATGSGKSRLSIDLASLFPNSEIINSDKMQVYRGLDITTNKIPQAQRRGVPHHLLGDVDPGQGELSPGEFRRRAGQLIWEMRKRGSLPLVVGGSNSFVHAALVEKLEGNVNVFDSPTPISSELRYCCCFLWVDIAFPVLSQHLRQRVDEMLDSGMVDELAEFFHSSPTPFPLRKAIGVPEFHRFFNQYPPSHPLRDPAYVEAVRAIKDNTCHLARRQIHKIHRLRLSGWDLRRIDATQAFLSGSHDVWLTQVLEPSVKIVKRFLME